MSAVSTAARLEQRINRASAWVLRHWLMFANCLLLMYAGLPWLAPLARAAGFERFGQLLFLLYLPLCHQRAERSFTVFGYQVAFCHRCAAMYTSILAGGLLFGLLRGRLRAAPL